MKKNIYIFFLLFLSKTISAQSSGDFLRLADMSFQNENYASAAYFYHKILISGGSRGRDIVYPYELKSYHKPLKGESEKTDSTNISKDSTITQTETKIESDSSGTKISITETSTEILYVMERLAECYRLSKNYENAEIWYQKLYELKVPFMAYWYGNSLTKNSKYERSVEVLSDFLFETAEANSDYFKKAEIEIKKCSFAQSSMQHPDMKTLVEKADSTVNVQFGSFGVIYSDENSIFFSSSRSSVSENESQPVFNCNLYKATIDENGNINDIKNFGSPVNSNDNEAAGILSPDKSKLFFTRWNNNPKNPECAIYVSKYLNGHWLTPKKLDEKVNFPGSKTMHPALSPDGNTLYFASDRTGGEGKFDLWLCTIDEFDNISDVKNLGQNVNTPEDEVTPFFDGETNTLYFSSEGHIGMGGLDIFRTYPDNDFNVPVENLGYPLNSSRDDAYPVISPGQKRCFFSSDRESCEECISGNCYKIYSFSPAPLIITISGKVYNSETKKVITNSLVSFTEIKERFEPIFAFTDENGVYKCLLHKDLEFFATAQKAKFFKDATAVNTLNITETTNLTHDFYLRPIPQGDIEIPGIEYDYDKATLRPRSKQILDTLVDFLKLNDNLIVEINSHTDERGNDDYNMKLSDARAKSCVDYLVEKGIPMERLVAKGYGESKPLIANAKTEEEHQRNRRTAFRILSEDYKPVKKAEFLKRDND